MVQFETSYDVKRDDVLKMFSAIKERLIPPPDKEATLPTLIDLEKIRKE